MHGALHCMPRVWSSVYIVHAAELMTEHKIAGLPVIDKDSSVIGIITESDLLRLLVRRLSGADTASAESAVAEDSIPA